MPIVFLSPSTQDWNPYVTGSGSEEYWMNRIVDAMEPYLRSNGIRLPPVHDKDKAFDSGRMLAHSSASKPHRGPGYGTRTE